MASLLPNTFKINITCDETTVVVSNTAGVVGADPGVAGCCCCCGLLEVLYKPNTFFFRLKMKFYL